MTFARLRTVIGYAYDTHGGFQFGRLTAADGSGPRSTILIATENEKDAVEAGTFVLVQPAGFPPPSARRGTRATATAPRRAISRARLPPNSAQPRILDSDDEDSNHSVRSFSTARSTDASIAPTDASNAESYVHVEGERPRRMRAASSASMGGAGWVPWVIGGGLSPVIGGRGNIEAQARRAWRKGQWALDPEVSPSSYL